MIPSLKLDYLTCSSDALKLDRVCEVLKEHRYVLDRCKGRYGYLYGFHVHRDQHALDDPLFTVYAGGETQKGVISFERSGPLAGEALRVLVRLFGADKFRATRLDVACDFEAVDFYLEARMWVVTFVEAWPFPGRRPGVREITDCNTGNGSTLYVGSGAKHLFRLYEKGKQLKRLDALNWVRAEAVHKPSKRMDQITAFQAAARGDLLAVWCMTPYAAFTDYLFGQQCERIQSAEVRRSEGLETRALHFVKQYYGLMTELIGHHEHGDWSMLGDLVQRLKRELDAGQNPTWTHEVILAEDMTYQELQQRCEAELAVSDVASQVRIIYIMSNT